MHRAGRWRALAVTLTNQDTGIEVKTTTNADGNYDFFNVKTGRYTVTVEKAGFSKSNATDIVVDVNARQRVDLTMQVGVVSDSVQVTGAASVLETDSSEHSQVVSSVEAVEAALLTAAIMRTWRCSRRTRSSLQHPSCLPPTERRAKAPST